MSDVEETLIMEFIDNALKEIGSPGAYFLIKAKHYVEELFPKKTERSAFLMSMLECIWEEDGISFEDAVEHWRKGRCWK